MLEFCAGGLCFKDYRLLNDFEAGLIYDWRNDPAVRKFMINPAPISFNEHFDFLAGLEARSCQRCYFYVYSNYPIGTINLTNISSGAGDLSGGEDLGGSSRSADLSTGEDPRTGKDLDGGIDLSAHTDPNASVDLNARTDLAGPSVAKSADLGLYIAPKLHGKGYGGQMLSAFLGSPFLRAQNIKILRLVVRQENTAAIALYKKCGFTPAAPTPAAQSAFAPDLLHFEWRSNR